MPGLFRMRRPMLAAVLLVVGLLVAVPVSPAAAAPGDEGGTPTLRQQLEEANKGFVEARAALEMSTKRQGELTQQVQSIERRLAELAPTVAGIAVAMYRQPRGGAAAALLDSGAPDSLLERMTTLDVITTENDRQLREVSALRGKLAEAKTAIDAEVAQRSQHLASMERRKQAAERALGPDGGQPAAGPTGSTAAAAAPAPRTANGTWPREACSVKDPTTSGCLTPRTLHALQQAKSAGFTRHVSCFRPYNDGGEHPQGRACDFAASATGFGGAATGGDRVYGNNLAAYFIANANNLAVYYAIWYCQIWMVSTGWRSYPCYGDPSAGHTNHLHVSIA